ncbi:MAG: hypothetical protein GYB68_16275, partial [Chloroflexi bacterium]|nr:hypothetical protein [Chloroflexota bacterium]
TCRNGEANENRPQELDSAFGKVIRINPDGSLPTDNPFYTDNGSDDFEDAIWALGLRHPYNIAFSTTHDAMYINDVGQNQFEEANKGVAGANFGWDSSLTDGPRSGYIDPQFYYVHNSGCGAITGGIFYEPGTLDFPAEYQGKYFYADYCFDWIRVYDPASTPGQVNAHDTATHFATGINRILRLEVGPDGRMFALTRFRDSGAGGTVVDARARIFLIDYEANPTAPTIELDPADTKVPVGFDATFECSASGNPAPSFTWELSEDGGTNWNQILGVTINQLTVENTTLGMDGDQYRCIATNGEGSVTSAVATLTVSDNQPPEPQITWSIDSGESTYTGADMISFGGTVTDDTSSLDATDFVWTVDQVHSFQEAPKPIFNAGDLDGQIGGSFEVSQLFAIGEANQYIAVTLSVSDGEFTGQQTVQIFPQTSTVTLNTDPAGLQVLFDNKPDTGGSTFEGVVGFPYQINVTSPQVSGDTTYTFNEWSNGANQLFTLTMPETPLAVTASFTGVPTGGGGGGGGGGGTFTPPPGGVDNILENGGFEDEGGWELVTTGDVDRFIEHPQALGDGRVFVFDANDVLEFLKQVVSDLNGSAGDLISFDGHLAGRNISSDGDIGVRIVLLDGDEIVGMQTCAFLGPRGTFEWQEFTCVLTAETAFDSVELYIGWRNVDEGLFGVDEVELVHTEN